MTETCSPGTGHPPDGPDKPGSIGLMLPGIEMDVVSLDDPTRCLPPAKPAKSASRARTSPRATGTARRRLPEPLSATASSPATSATWMSDGFFYLVDRKKDMIISGGFNVYPQMIEQAIYEHPAVQEVIVIGSRRSSIAARPPRPSSSCARAQSRSRIDELRAFLTGKLGKHELPAAVEFVDDLPRTAVGKLSRHELRA